MSHLSDQAATLSAGQWAQLTISGYGTSRAAQPAFHRSKLAGPYSISNGVNDTLRFSVTGGGDQDVDLTAGSRTAQQICDDINAQTTGITASVVDSRVHIATDATNEDQSLATKTISNSAYTTLGLRIGTRQGYGAFDSFPTGSTGAATNPGGNFTYHNKGTYTLEGQLVVVCAKPHIATNNPFVGFVYDIPNNQIVEIPIYDLAESLNTTEFHSAQHLTFSPRTRRFYYGPRWNTTNFYYLDFGRYYGVSATEDADRLIDIIQEDWTTAADITHTGPVSHQDCTEYSPERRKVLYWDQANDYLVEHNEHANTWATVESNVTNQPAANNGGHMYHSAKHKLTVFGGGGSDNRKWNKISATGTSSALDDCPYEGLYLTTSLGCADPVSGNIFFISNDNPAGGGSGATAYRVYKLDPTAGAGTQWSRLNGSPNYESAIPNFGHDGNPGTVTGAVMVPLWDLGVILLLAATNAYVWKVTDNTWATDGVSISAKSTGPGVLGYEPFNDQTRLKYAYDTGESALSAAIADLGDPTNYAITDDRTPGQGNTLAYRTSYTGALSVPQIEGGWLKFTLPSESYEGFGTFQMNNDGVLYTLGNAPYIGPASNLGAVVWYQSKFKASASYWNTDYRKFSVDNDYNNEFDSDPALGSISCSTGSTTVTSTGAGFKSGFVGRTVIIRQGTNFVEGKYTITGFNSPTSITLNTTPCPSGNGTGAQLLVAGPSNLIVDGAKQIVITGDPPWYGSSTSNVMVNVVRSDLVPSQKNHPQMYGHQGNDSPPGANTTVPFNTTGNAEQEITIRFELRGASNDPETRITWWIDGVKHRSTDWQTARLVHSDGVTGANGVGQYQIAPQMTHKDPNQVHDVAYVYWKDFIVSTDPIPFRASAASEPPPEPPPSVSNRKVLPFLIRA